LGRVRIYLSPFALPKYAGGDDNKNNNKERIIFNSLASGYEEIKYSLLGVAGVYKLTNKRDAGRIYIGSSVNLARERSTG
jgi:hypothetical protein